MKNDYARLAATGRRRRYSNNQSHAGLWLFTIFLFVIFTLGLVFLGKYQRHDLPGTYAKKRKVEVPRIIEKKTNETHLVHKVSVSPPKFEFKTPQQASSQADIKNAAKKIALESSVESKKIEDSKANNVMLEVIKTKSKVDAEKMRARLALIGIESTVVKVREQKSIYYKIELGPYDKNTAMVKQQLLKSNHIR